MARRARTPLPLPAEPPRRGFWMRRVEDGIRGVAEALFPPNDLGAPDWQQTDLVARTVGWMQELPPRQRRLIALLFILVELAAPLLVPGLRRFSRRSPRRRLSAIRRWRASRLRPLRMVGDALKATLTMMYLSHPAALTWIEMFKGCAHPEDPLAVELRPGALEAHAPRARGQAS